MANLFLIGSTNCMDSTSATTAKFAAITHIKVRKHFNATLVNGAMLTVCDAWEFQTLLTSLTSHKLKTPFSYGRKLSSRKIKSVGCQSKTKSSRIR